MTDGRALHDLAKSTARISHAEGCALPPLTGVFRVPRRLDCQHAGWEFSGQTRPRPAGGGSIYIRITAVERSLLGDQQRLESSGELGISSAVWIHSTLAGTGAVNVARFWPGSWAQIIRKQPDHTRSCPHSRWRASLSIRRDQRWTGNFKPAAMVGCA